MVGLDGEVRRGQTVMYFLESISPYDNYPDNIGIFTSIDKAQAYIDSRYPDVADRALTPWPMPGGSTYEITIGDTKFFLDPMEVDSLYEDCE